MNLPRSADLLIADTSPLLALARIDALALLPKLFEQVLLTDSVWRECTAKPERQDAFRIIAAEQQKLIKRVADPEVRAGLAGLDRGEQTALELAWQRQAMVLLDERRGRLVAKANGIRVIGALGVLLLAKRQGLLPKVEPLLQQLKNSGYFLDEVTIANMLILADE